MGLKKIFNDYQSIAATLKKAFFLLKFWQYSRCNSCNTMRIKYFYKNKVSI